MRHCRYVDAEVYHHYATVHRPHGADPAGGEPGRATYVAAEVYATQPADTAAAAQGAGSSSGHRGGGTGYQNEAAILDAFNKAKSGGGTKAPQPAKGVLGAGASRPAAGVSRPAAGATAMADPAYRGFDVALRDEHEA